MIRILRACVLLLIPAICLPLNAQKKVPPGGITVEFIRDASGTVIMDLNPEFSWIVPAGYGMQKSYQILVATSLSELKKDRGNAWDSGIVESSNSVNVECGKELSPATTYFWKVRITGDKPGKGPWSEPMAFRTGKPEGYSTTTNRFISELREPATFKKTSANSYFADFGKDAFGTLILKASPVALTTVTVHLGEKLSEDGKIDRNPGGSIRYSKTELQLVPGQSEHILKLQKDTRNTTGAAVLLPDSVGVITPFRYCEIENCSVPLTGTDIIQKAHFYYFEDNSSSFESSDTVLNKVWEICKYSMKATSFAGLYVDGDRERIPYEADAYINQLGHYYTDREYSIARRTNEYFIDHPTWPTEWLLQTVPMFWNDYMFTGNTGSLRNFYDRLRVKTLIDIADEDGLISSERITAELMKSLGFRNEKEKVRDIVDWPPAQKDTGWKLATPEGERDGYDMVKINTVVNAFYYNGLVLYSRIASVLGKAGDAELFRLASEKTKAAINSILLEKTKGYYTDGKGSDHSSLHANMLPLAFGLVPEEYKKSVIDFIKSRGMACSVYGAQYLLEGLYREGAADYALALMTATHDRSWYNMIRTGSTITLEAWDMKYKPNSDWNHAWGAAPASIIPGFLWGISPAEPGWSKAEIKPSFGNLEYSKISIPTIRGTIEAEYQKSEGKDVFRITLPGNMQAVLKLRGNVIMLKPGFSSFRFN